MIEHEELVAEMATVEKMQIADRLKHATKRRTMQLKTYGQFEKQSNKEKEKDRKSKKSRSEVAPRKTTQLRFVDSVLLLDAAAKNDLVEVKNLLNAGASPDCSNEDGLTVLHQCCIDGQSDMMKLLLENGANVNSRDSELWTPLHAAATCGHLRLCQLLITHGGDLLAVNADGNMAYDLCDDVPTLEYIETEMSKRGVTQEHIDEMRLLAENAMLSDMQNILNDGGKFDVRGRSGETPLHVAACNGYVRVLELLLSHGLPVNVVDNDGWQPLHCAMCWGQVDAITILLEFGADVDAATHTGESALDLCDDLEMRGAVLNLLSTVQHKQLTDLHSATVNVDRHNSSLRRGSAGMLGSHSVMRRPSVHEKDAMSAKDARDEGLHVLEMMAAVSQNDDDDDDNGESMHANHAETVEEDHNSDVLSSTSEPVVSTADTLAEKSPTSLESPQPSSSSVPSSSTVQQPVLDSEAEVEVPATDVSLTTSSQAGDESVQQSTSVVAVHNSASDVSASADNIQPPEHLTPQPHPPAPSVRGSQSPAGALLPPEHLTPQPHPPAPSVRGSQSPAGALLLELKQRRAKQRQERMHNSQSAYGNNAELSAIRTNGAVINGVDGTTAHLPVDDTVYVGTRRRYSNCYDIAAPDDKGNCCVLM